MVNLFCNFNYLVLQCLMIKLVIVTNSYLLQDCQVKILSISYIPDIVTSIYQLNTFQYSGDIFQYIDFYCKKKLYINDFCICIKNKDDNIHKQRSSKKSDLYLHMVPRKSRFSLNLPDRQTNIRIDIRTDIHTVGRTYIRTD